MCVLISVGFPRGPRDRGFKSAPEPYHTVGNDGKLVYLYRLTFSKYIKK